MIYSSKHKFIFIAVPKTGTTSIESCLLRSGDCTASLQSVCEITGIQSEPGDNNGKKHITAIELKHRLKGIYEQCFTFAYTRNPWARLVSLFNYRYRLPDPDNKQFRKFINEHTGVHTKPNIRPALDYLTDSEGNIIVDYIGKMENIQQDYNYISSKIGIPSTKLPVKNKSDHKHYTEYYDDEMRHAVMKKYVADIEYSEYVFGE